MRLIFSLVINFLNPSSPPKPPLIIFPGCILGFLVKPAKELMTEISGKSCEIIFEILEASSVPPRSSIFLMLVGSSNQFPLMVKN